MAMKAKLLGPVSASALHGPLGSSHGAKGHQLVSGQFRFYGVDRVGVL